MARRSAIRTVASSVMIAFAVLVVGTLALSKLTAMLGAAGENNVADGDSLSPPPATLEPPADEPLVLVREHLSETVTPSLHEPPLLAPLVEAGTLPPLPDRLPDRPLVLVGVDGAEAGRYGGTWLRLANAEGDVGVIGNRLSLTTPLRWSPRGEPVVPHFAQRVEASDDRREFIIHLRPGHRWSDGTPMTSADVMYWWERELNDPQLGGGSVPTWLMHVGRSATLEAPDAATLVVRFEHPNGLFVQKLASLLAFEMFASPRHYLEPFHPTHGDAELIERTLEATGQPSASSLYRSLKQWRNPEHPRLWPWVYIGDGGSAPHVFARNPYYFAVDAQGRQLPYIDRVQFDIQSGELIPLAATNGQASMQARHLRFDKFTDLMSRQASGGYRVHQWMDGSGSAWLINPNLNRANPDDDPHVAAKAELLRNADFRRALSLAIDRERIAEAQYGGKTTPSQIAPPADSPFFDADAAEAYTAYDPVQAERLLDGLGLKRDGEHGMRRSADGQPLTFFLDFSPFTGPGPMQFVVDDWMAVGVRTIPRSRARSIFMLSRGGGTADFLAWTGESDVLPLLYPRNFVPHEGRSFWAGQWGRWFEFGGLQDSDAAVARGGVAPPEGGDVLRAMRLYQDALEATDPYEQAELFKRVARLAAENVWTINLTTSPPQLVVVDEDIRNVPRHAISGNVFGSPGHAGIETYYFASAENSRGAVEEARRALGAHVVIYTAATTEAGDLRSPSVLVRETSRVVVWLVRGVGIGAVLGLLLLAAKFPFVGKRLLIMVPTLAILSVVIFVIIQAPPGDYLTAQLIQLEASGDPTAERQIEELKELHHFDDSLIERYLRWIGLTWFVTFDAQDTGL
ncbi:MAG: ABC transporter substrate-binding protein, partial [Planctomycetota bacterium]